MCCVMIGVGMRKWIGPTYWLTIQSYSLLLPSPLARRLKVDVLLVLFLSASCEASLLPVMLVVLTCGTSDARPSSNALGIGFLTLTIGYSYFTGHSNLSRETGLPPGRPLANLSSWATPTVPLPPISLERVPSGASSGASGLGFQALNRRLRLVSCSLPLPIRVTLSRSFPCGCSAARFDLCRLNVFCASRHEPNDFLSY
jgi:hypothetical protein